MTSVWSSPPAALDSLSPDGSAPNPPSTLEAGDRLDQVTFHARYEAMPENAKAELIGGVVYMPSPLKPPHGWMHKLINRWFDEYEEATPGVEGYDNTSHILNSGSEPQPDNSLLILPDKGGRTRVGTAGYFEGSPELFFEIATSTESIDLHGKKLDYEQASVLEYVVVALRQKRVFWFVSRDGRFEELTPSPDGVLRSKVFPGLWLDPTALLRRDRKQFLAVLRQGLASQEHADFVAALAKR